MIVKREIHMVEDRIKKYFDQFPDVLYGFADISSDPLGKDYCRALMIAVPYVEQLSIKDYKEERFEKCIIDTRERLEAILVGLKNVLSEESIRYYIPPVAQKNEVDLMAEFSFKSAAVKAGLGWFGKNDLLVTPEYGPRVRLSAVLIDHPFNCSGEIIESRCSTCDICVRACPHKAIKGINWNPSLDRVDLIDYQLCNQKRSEYIKSKGRKHACGFCLVTCPYGL